MPEPKDRPIWVNSDRFLPRKLVRPAQRFLDIEASGGILLLAATIVALLWANSPWSDSYHQFWHSTASFRFGDFEVSESLVDWVNDGLMVLFFFVVGLEIKQELVTGHLSKFRDAILPAVAAIGGMIVPALLFFALNSGTAGVDGWGIPMATDIAFAVGVLALLGDRVPNPLKIILLALAIVDDIGAITVIAVFYSDDLNLVWGAIALAGVVVVLVMQRVKIWYVPAYAVIGVGIWFATLESGVHATIAGVLLGLIAPARSLLPEPDAGRIADKLSGDSHVTVDEVHQVSFELRESVSVAERLQQVLHPWTSYVIVPLFALANAGIVLSRDVVSHAVTSRITIGVIIGLVIGKFVGVTGAVTLMTRTGLAKLPTGVNLRQIAGMSLIAGIGFTVSLFISGLAFSDPLLDAEAKIGILFASLVAAIAGVIVLRAVLPKSSQPTAETDL